jgi:hypothetical protein
MQKIIVSACMIVTNNKKLPVTNFEKRTQTNPILKGAQVKDKYDLKIHLFKINCPIVVRDLFD